MHDAQKLGKHVARVRGCSGSVGQCGDRHDRAKRFGESPMQIRTCETACAPAGTREGGDEMTIGKLPQSERESGCVMSQVGQNQTAFQQQSYRRACRAHSSASRGATTRCLGRQASSTKGLGPAAPRNRVVALGLAAKEANLSLQWERSPAVRRWKWVRVQASLVPRQAFVRGPVRRRY